ncbi:MAG: hypothetical protein ACOYIF_00665 [Acetivibrionales bacterium]
MQVLIFDYTIVNKRSGCCDLKRSMDCGRNPVYERAKQPRNRAIDVIMNTAKRSTTP